MSDIIVPSNNGRPRDMLIAEQGCDPVNCPTTLDVGTAEGRAALLNAMNTPDLYIGPEGWVCLEVKHFLAYPVSKLDEATGEIAEFSNLVLIQPDGSRFATSSEPVAHRLAQLIRMEGMGPWDPPLQVIVRQRKARRSGRTYHELEVLSRE